MVIVNTEFIPGMCIKEIKGLVQGNTVRAKHMGRDIMAGLKNIVGGELKGYTELLVESRREALARMLAQAKDLLEPYWDNIDRIWNKYGPELRNIYDQITTLERTNPVAAKQVQFQYPQILMARREVALFKKRWDVMNPEAAYLRNLFYGY